MSQTLTEQHKLHQRDLYDTHLLDDLPAQAGVFGFQKPKLIRDLFFERWLRKLHLQKGDRVLDVGCNAGARLEQLRREFGIEGVGIDYSPNTVRAGVASFPKLELHAGDAEHLPFPDQSFDAVISFETFEHLPNPDQALAEMARVLKPGGKMLIYAISSQNTATWHWWQYHLTGGRLGTGALKDHTPDLLISPKELASWGRTSQLTSREWGYFHSFFTLLYDEVVVGVVAGLALALKKRIVHRSSLATPTRGADDLPQQPGRLFDLYKAWLYALASVLYLADTPWRLLRFSDGIFVLFERPRTT